MKRKLMLSVSTIAFVVTVIFLSSAFGNTKPNEEDSGYIGSHKCIYCHYITHPGIIKEWKASPHHLTMKPGLENKDALEELKINPSLKKEEILAVIGNQDGRYVFIGRGFRVFLSEKFQMDEPFPPHNEIDPKEKRIDASQKCFGCHTTGYFVSKKRYAEVGVGCEACHGPGKKHADSGDSREDIINPSRLSPEQSRMVCGQCHSIGKDPSGKHPFPVMNGGKPFQPGEDLTLGFVDEEPIIDTKGGEYSTFVNAPKPYSEQVCTDCHAPHGKMGNPSMLSVSTSALCLKCHGNPLTEIAQVNPERHWGADKQPCWFCHIYAHIH